MKRRHYAIYNPKTLEFVARAEGTWDKVQSVIASKYSGMVAKKASPEALEAFEGCGYVTDKYNLIGKKEVKEGELYAFVDGSYNDNTKEAGAACIITDSKGNVIQKYLSKVSLEDKPELVSQRNIAGEMKACLLAGKYAKDNNTKINIVYDYIGLGMWLLGAFKTKNPYTEAFVKYFEGLEDKIKLIWVPSHQSGQDFFTKGNAVADYYAGLVAFETAKP